MTEVAYVVHTLGILQFSGENEIDASLIESSWQFRIIRQLKSELGFHEGQ